MTPTLNAPPSSLDVSPIDLALVGQDTGIKGVRSATAFDAAAAAAGRYVLTQTIRVSGGPGSEPAKTPQRFPIQSVGRSRSRPGLYYFAADQRFLNWPGFECLWPLNPVER